MVRKCFFFIKLRGFDIPIEDRRGEEILFNHPYISREPTLVVQIIFTGDEVHHVGDILAGMDPDWAKLFTIIPSGPIQPLDVRKDIVLLRLSIH